MALTIDEEKWVKERVVLAGKNAQVESIRKEYMGKITTKQAEREKLEKERDDKITALTKVAK